MAKARLIALAALVLLGTSCQYEYEYSWQKYVMDGHRTGVKAPAADNVPETLGVIEGSTYTAPNGRTFQEGSATYGVARDMIKVQPLLEDLKTVVGTATRSMAGYAPESELSNWWVDTMMKSVARLTKRKGRSRFPPDEF